MGRVKRNERERELTQEVAELSVSCAAVYHALHNGSTLHPAAARRHLVICKEFNRLLYVGYMSEEGLSVKESLLKRIASR